MAGAQAPPAAPIPLAPAVTTWQAPGAPPAAPLPPAPLPPVPVALPAPPAPAGVVPGRVMMFQRPGERKDDPESTRQTAPQPPGQLPPTQSDPATGAQAGKGVTGPAAAKVTPVQSAVNRSTAFRLESDADLNRRMLDELFQEAVAQAKDQAADQAKGKKFDPQAPPPSNPTRDQFKLPEVQPIVPAGTVYQAKTLSYPPRRVEFDANYVVHRRLYFEEINAERYGWDFGIVQPFLSAAAFYKDVFLFPAHYASHPSERYETSAGKCRPGDPTPYYLYPPEIDLWGYAAQTSAIVGAGFVFPTGFAKP